jgi:hypothetical protein
MSLLVKERQVVARLGLRSGFELAFVMALFAVGLAACSVSVLKARPDAGSNDAPDAGLGGGTGGSALATGGAGGLSTGGSAGATPDAAGTPDAAADQFSDVTSDVTADGGGDATDARGDSATERGGDSQATVCASCTSWGQPVTEGPSPSALVELSGLAASHLHPGILYGHNDSGDTARFFAMTEQAHVNAELHLTGNPTATDWEDVSVGPCPTGSCIYLGDTGDNKLERSQYVIHRVAEPATLPSDGSIVTVSYESFPFVYPDGPHNAETLLVHPITGQVFVVIKEAGILATVYEMPLPLQAGQVVTLTRVTSLAVPIAEGVVTDGSFHPCGDRLLIRTTSVTGLFEMTRTPGQSLSTLFGATPVMVPVALEPQGESVTYAVDGRRYFTGSETVSSTAVPNISVVTCQN